MKTNITQIVLSGLFLAAITFYSCKKEDTKSDGTTTTGTTSTTATTGTTGTGSDTTEVSFTYTPSSTTTANLGSILTISINCTAGVNNNLKKFTMTATGSATALMDVDISTAGLTTDFKDSLETLGSRTYTMTLTGYHGAPVVKSFTINVVQAATHGALDMTVSPVPLFGQQNNPGVNANFLQLTNPFATFTTPLYAANKSNVDLVFYYGATNKATITSPSDGVMQGLYSGLDWSNARTTSLYKTTLTSAQFDAIAMSSIDSAITAMAATVTGWTSSVNRLSAGTIVLFRSQDNRLGLINIKAVGGTSAVDGSIAVDVLAQE